VPAGASLATGCTRAALVAVLLAAAAVGCSGGAGPDPNGFPVQPYLTVMSDSKALQVEVRSSPQPPTRGTVDVELAVTNVAEGKPQDGLTVHIQPWMPAHNHGAISPAVTPKGNGKYLVTEVDLFMAGHWELRTTFSGPVSDHAAPAFDIP
jgi:hypothetical protein